MFPSLLQDRSKPAEFAVIERTRIVNRTKRIPAQIRLCVKFAPDVNDVNICLMVLCQINIF
jgi:hypothetical protein